MFKRRRRMKKPRKYPEKNQKNLAIMLGYKNAFDMNETIISKWLKRQFEKISITKNPIQRREMCAAAAFTKSKSLNIQFRPNLKQRQLNLI